MKMTTECVQFHGGYEYCCDYRAGRLLLSAKVTQILEGATRANASSLIGALELND